MKTLLIDRSKLVRAIAQLTHAEVDAAEWPWMVVFDPDEDRPEADVQLPDRINSQGGFHTLRSEEPDQPESAAGLDTPAAASPFDFVDLDRTFQWNGEMPDASDDQFWERQEIRGVTDRIVTSLRDQIEIDGVRYRVEYI